jgi:pyruvate,water dikinase
VRNNFRTLAHNYERLVRRSASFAGMNETRLLVNLSEPSQVDRAAALDVDGVGLLRAELMVLEALGGDHPRTLLEEGRGEDFVSAMADGVSAFAAAFAPRPITYRTIDFRTNEFRGLRGGERFEPQESNPMIGYRGALRYTREPDVFELELSALLRVWDEGHTNLHVMLPFVRSTAELRRCRALMERSGLLERPGGFSHSTCSQSPGPDRPLGVQRVGPRDVDDLDVGVESSES